MQFFQKLKKYKIGKIEFLNCFSLYCAHDRLLRPLVDTFLTKKKETLKEQFLKKTH
jgi:hypothetical protein